MDNNVNLESIRVNIKQLEPFSGVLYDDKGNKTPIKGNPFYVPDNYLDNNDKDSESIRRLHASIEQEGVLTPLLVRHSKGKKDKYEILSGYRRKKVCEELAKKESRFQEIPIIIIDCDDDEASSIITSSNVQRQEVSFLDTIISCGRMYRALKHRGSGKNKDLTANVVANVLGLTPRSVERYTLLLDLPEFMLQLIGRKTKTQNGELRLAISAGEVFHGVDKAKVELINQIMKKDDNIVVTRDTAMNLKKACKKNPEITIEEIERMILEEASSKEEEPSVKKRRFSPGGDLTEAIDVYCHDMSDQQVEELLCDLLKNWGESLSSNTTDAESTQSTQSD